ncbi:MAG: hypothetical protein HKN20_05180, partial [Gemmatimonadetes bacterium]|nr:hypothetical protein [Gemmatimonadota bacterium]
YERYNFGLRFKWNAADFYDLFGPTKRSRKGYSVGANYRRTLVSDDPRSLVLNLGTTAFWDLERLPDYQNVSTSSSRLVSSSASITYTNQRASIGAIDYEKGTMLELMAWNSVVRGEAFPAVVVNADGGVALPLGHSSVWLRNSAGYSPGERDEPYANFFFGGFGNNWVDDGRVKRYREFYSFPGLELNELGGTNYVKSTLELNLPPLRFRRLGTPGCHATWLRPALFAMGAVTNLDDGGTRTEVASAGTQLDLRLSLLSHLDLTFSIGYAAAFEKNRRHRDEFMFSLKVL